MLPVEGAGRRLVRWPVTVFWSKSKQIPTPPHQAIAGAPGQ
jgi:hypothetical protein